MMATSSTKNFDKYERKLNQTASKNLLGHVRVEISSLDFKECRGVDNRVVQGLVELFQKDHCRRYNPNNFIKASISPEQLKSALLRSKLTQKALKSASQDGNFPFLYPTSIEKIVCFEGRQRTRAAELFFNDPHDHWWTLKLYLKRPKDDYTSEWKDQYYHQANLSAGEIYCKVWPYWKTKDSKEVDRWMQRLSPSGRVGLRQLLNREDFTTALEGLLPFPGPWAGLEVGNIQRNFAAHADEEWLRCCYHIVDILNKITLKIDRFRAALDIQTIELIQCRAPASCISDREFIRNAMKTGLLFPTITDKDDRKVLKKALLKIECLIPSMKSMQENMKLVHVGSKLIKDLILGDKSKRTIHDSLYAHWKKGTDIFVEGFHGKIKPVGLSEEACWKLVYKQAWIAILRSFAELGGRQPLKEPGQTSRTIVTVPTIQFKLAKLLSALGIRTPKIEARLASDSRRETLRLSIAQLYGSRSEKFQEKLVDKMLEKLPTYTEDEDAPKSIPQNEGSSDLQRRWGIPFQNAYEAGKRTFFLPELLTSVSRRPVQTLSVSFIQYDFLKAFFGPTEIFKAVIVEEEDGSSGSEEEDDSGSGTDGQEDVQMDSDNDSQATSTDVSSMALDEQPLQSPSHMKQIATSTITFDTQHLPTQDGHIQNLPHVVLGTHTGTYSPPLVAFLNNTRGEATDSHSNFSSDRIAGSTTVNPPHISNQEQTERNKGQVNEALDYSPEHPAMHIPYEPVSPGQIAIERTISLDISLELPRSPLALLPYIKANETNEILPSFSRTRGQAVEDQRQLLYSQPEVVEVVDAFQSTLDFTTPSPELQLLPNERTFAGGYISEQPLSPIMPISPSQGSTSTPSQALQGGVNVEQARSPILSVLSSSSYQALQGEVLPPPSRPLLSVSEERLEEWVSNEQPRSPLLSMLPSDSSKDITSTFNNSSQAKHPPLFIEHAKLPASSTEPQTTYTNLENMLFVDSTRSTVLSNLSSGTVRASGLAIDSTRLTVLSNPSSDTVRFSAQAPVAVQSSTSSQNLPTSSLEVEISPEPRISALVLGVPDDSTSVRWTDVHPESQQFTFSLPPSLPRSGLDSVLNTHPVSEPQNTPNPIEEPGEHALFSSAAINTLFNTKLWLERIAALNVPPDLPRSAIPSPRRLTFDTMEGVEENRAEEATSSTYAIDQVMESSTPVTMDLLETQLDGIAEPGSLEDNLPNLDDTLMSELMEQSDSFMPPTRAPQMGLNGHISQTLPSVVSPDVQMIPEDPISKAERIEILDYPTIGDSPQKVPTEMALDDPTSEVLETVVSPEVQRKLDNASFEKLPSVRFYKYENEKLNRVLYTIASMENYLARCQNFTMFVLDRKVFRVIPRSRIIRALESHPEKTYCFVERESMKLWRRQGIGILTNHKPTAKGLKKQVDQAGNIDPFSRDRKVERKSPKRSTIVVTAVQRPLIGKMLLGPSVHGALDRKAPTDSTPNRQISASGPIKKNLSQADPITEMLAFAPTLLTFPPGLEILGCEQEFRRFVTSELPSNKSAFMVYNDHTLRTFVQPLRISKLGIDAIDATFQCFWVQDDSFQTEELGRISIERVAEVVHFGYPIWLVPLNESSVFERIRKNCLYRNKSADLALPVPGHPDTQEFYDERELFEDESHQEAITELLQIQTVRAERQGSVALHPKLLEYKETREDESHTRIEVPSGTPPIYILGPDTSSDTADLNQSGQNIDSYENLARKQIPNHSLSSKRDAPIQQGETIDVHEPDVDNAEHSEETLLFRVQNDPGQGQIDPNSTLGNGSKAQETELAEQRYRDNAESHRRFGVYLKRKLEDISDINTSKRRIIILPKDSQEDTDNIEL